ncbi:MAG: tyrosine--tRNA ligase, partial [Erysipelotrichaceae bacterium]|nr:tyrosine--tRNA ligase [Erysipelotrichaceae bacterium]
MGIYEDLQWRGLIKDESSPELRDLLNKGGMTFYIGTDPTGDSLHIGHFSSFLISKRLKDAGHNPILLVGGGTGLIGDPKPDAERPMITVEEVNHNFECLKAQAEKVFGFEVVNNYDWLKDFTYIEWLRDVGKYFNIG